MSAGKDDATQKAEETSGLLSGKQKKPMAFPGLNTNIMKSVAKARKKMTDKGKAAKRKERERLHNSMLTKEQEAELRYLFDDHDDDGSGSIEV